MRARERKSSWRRIVGLCGCVSLTLVSGCGGDGASAPAPITARDVTLTKRVDSSTHGECNGWKLDAEDVAFFFANAKVMTGEEWHAVYYTLPCDYEGTLTIGGKRYNFDLNAGSYAIAYGPNVDQIFYGCIRACAALFPFELYDDEDGSADE